MMFSLMFPAQPLLSLLMNWPIWMIMYDLNFLAMPLYHHNATKRVGYLYNVNIFFFLHETSSWYLSALTSMVNTGFFFTQLNMTLCLERTLTILDKYGCHLVFECFCFLSYFYICLFVNDLLPVYAPSWSSESFFFLTSPLNSRRVYVLDLWLPGLCHWVLMGLTASVCTNWPPRHSHTCTLILRRP